MNPHSGTNDDDNNNIRKAKAIAAIPMAGIIVTAVLVSGLVPFMGNSYPPAIAQTGNTTTTTSTTTGGGQFPCAPVQTGGAGGGGETTTGGGTVGSGGAGGEGTAGGIITGSGTTTGGAATTDMNATTSSTTTDEGNQPIGEVAIHIQEACLAAHNNDIPGVLLHLNLALDALNAVRGGGGGATNATAAIE
jgi:hypothetical protein